MLRTVLKAWSTNARQRPLREWRKIEERATGRQLLILLLRASIGILLLAIHGTRLDGIPLPYLTLKYREARQLLYFHSILTRLGSLDTQILVLEHRSHVFRLMSSGGVWRDEHPWSPTLKLNFVWLPALEARVLFPLAPPKVELMLIILSNQCGQKWLFSRDFVDLRGLPVVKQGINYF